MQKATATKKKRAYQKHGLSNTRFYWIWRGVKMRTTNPKHKSFHRYGGRGIRLAACYEDPLVMFNDLGGDVPPGLTLERSNFNKGYVPGNVCYADWYTQMNNRRSSVKYDYDGRELTMSELARAVGLPYHTLNKRIKILGWSVEKAIAQPKKKWTRRAA